MLKMTNLEIAKENYLAHESLLGPYATKSREALRLKRSTSDFRTPYYKDIDKIIHSLSYTRYDDKTQVYSFKKNDHISKRIIHVQLVSKIARTIGRALCLNEDLIEAISLGHDIGHTPLGHTGEAILNEISERELHESFAHNIQSVRYFMEVENDGKGLNLTIQTLDGMMCHNGEIVEDTYYPVTKTKDEFLREYHESYKDLKKSLTYHPMTLEGCVMRISDVIAYIGRDIEDAINLGLFNRADLPQDITKVLGDNNKDIVNTLIVDIINNSMNKPYIKMSPEVSTALTKLKDFNYHNIYAKSLSTEDIAYYKEGMNKLFAVYLKAIETNDKTNIIYTIFLNKQHKTYLDTTSPKRMVIDFIAGMTDDLFLSEIKAY